MTGIILAMARAIGEAAPLIVVGAVGFVTFLPTPFQQGFTRPADPGLPMGEPAAGGLPGRSPRRRSS